MLFKNMFKIKFYYNLRETVLFNFRSFKIFMITPGNNKKLSK